MSSLIVQNLSFWYEKNRPVLAGLNFEAKPGKVLGLAGANGCGKSTLLNILAGILKPKAGALMVGDLKAAEARSHLRRHAALLPQNIDHWLIGETGEEDLYLGLNRKDENLNRRIEVLAQRWQLGDLLARPVETMSLGQKKRLGMAAALAKEPRAVLLDEPMAGLDWPGQNLMLQDLARLKATKTITVLVTHEPFQVWNLVDAWLLLKTGGQYFLGSPAEVAPRLEDFETRPL